MHANLRQNTTLFATFRSLSAHGAHTRKWPPTQNSRPVHGVSKSVARVATLARPFCAETTPGAGQPKPSAKSIAVRRRPSPYSAPENFRRTHRPSYRRHVRCRQVPSPLQGRSPRYAPNIWGSAASPPSIANGSFASVVIEPPRVPDDESRYRHHLGKVVERRSWMICLVVIATAAGESRQTRMRLSEAEDHPWKDPFRPILHRLNPWPPTFSGPLAASGAAFQTSPRRFGRRCPGRSGEARHSFVMGIGCLRRRIRASASHAAGSG